MDYNETKLILKCAIDLCGITGSCDADNLVDYTYNFIVSRQLTKADKEQLKRVLSEGCRGASLFRAYHNALEKVKSREFVKALQRRIWLYELIANNFQHLDFPCLLERVEKIFEDERTFDPVLTENKFSLFYDVKSLIKNADSIKTVGPYLYMMSDLFPIANEKLLIVSEIYDCDYLSKLYSEQEAIVSMTVSQSEYEAYRVAAQEEIKRIAKEKEKLALTLNQFREAAQKNEQTLKDAISMLQKNNDILITNLSHAKKDVIREILISLTNKGFGAPLNELYVIMKKIDMQEPLKGVINNLFMALNAIGIRIKDKQYGELIVLSAENQKGYDPFPNEELFIGDSARIVYPGYWFEGENMVRPIVKKEKGDNL